MRFLVQLFEDDLGEILGCYIMPYSLDVFRTDLLSEQHLCCNIERASLSGGQLDRLLQLEETLKPLGISLSAYQKPLSVTTKPLPL